MRLASCIALLAMLAPPGLASQMRDPMQLNVSVAIFAPGIPEDRSLHRDLQVFPRVREIEALYLPFVLRETLVKTRQWGAVRVVPAADAAAELSLTATILKSDGDTLSVRCRVVDASGETWLEQAFGGPQQQVFSDIAAALLAARGGRDGKALSNIIAISELRYAQELAPAAFDDYLERAADGIFRIRRLPAGDDPMLARIERIRGVEYVFTDAIDAKFRELSTDIERVYAVWREYRRKFAQYQADEVARIKNTKNSAPRGSFEAISGHYENYKWDRQALQEQEKWAIGFDNEMGPTIAKIEARVAELEGWVADRYDEWRRILAELFEVETALPE